MPGGSDHVEKRTSVVKRTRIVDGKPVLKEFTRERAHGVAYQMAGLQLIKEHVQASKRGRAAQLKSEAALETKRLKLEYSIAARVEVIEQLSSMIKEQ